MACWDSDLLLSLSTLSDLRGVYFNEGKATSYVSVEAY